MSQFNVRFNIYDPAVENILNVLKSCNKQAAFVRDAVKFYAVSKQGLQTFDLMCEGKRKKTKASANSPTSQKKGDFKELPEHEANSDAGQPFHKQDNRENQKTILDKIFS
jgi:hypothetical protein